MTSRRSVPAPALPLLVALLVLAGCARIPTSGPIVSGGEAGADRALQAIVPGPAADATPAEIVGGFLAASLSPNEEYAVARSFLTPAAAADWQPSAATVVYRDAVTVAGLVESPDPDEREDATVTATQVASISADGHLDRTDDTRTQVELELVTVGGQWRISSLPDLTLVSDTDLDFVFDSYPVYFLDPTMTYLVADPRWLPNSGTTASRLASLVLAGPPQWLAPAVTTAFGRGVRLSTPGAVHVTRGVATVDLTEQARQASTESRALMHAQLVATLRLLPTVEDVELRADSTVLDVSEVDVPTEPMVGSDPHLLVDGRIMLLQGGSTETLVDDPALQALDPEAIAVSFDAEADQRYAAVSATGTQLYVGQVRSGEGLVALTGTNLTAPSFDWRGWLWSTESMTDGDVTVVAPDGTVTTVAAPWLQGRRVSALRVGRSGSLVALASADGSGRSTVQLASVERAADGRPLTLRAADPDPAGHDVFAVRDLAWVGPSELVVLGRRDADEGYRVLALEVGGPQESALPALSDARRVTGGFGLSSLLVGTGGAGLSSLTGTQWAEVSGATGATAAAFPG